MWGPQTLGRGLEEVFAWESPWPQAAGQLPPSSCLPCRSGGPHRDVALGAGSPGTPKGRHPVLHVQVSAPLSELPDQGGPHGSYHRGSVLRTDFEPQPVSTAQASELQPTVLAQQPLTLLTPRPLGRPRPCWRWTPAPQPGALPGPGYSRHLAHLCLRRPGPRWKSHPEPPFLSTQRLVHRLL